MQVLKTCNLTKQYGKKTVVDNLNMTINKGDIYGFIGKNGAGKTTVMRMILTLANPTSGSVELFGDTNLLEGCKKIGSLIETPAVPNGISARECLKRYSVLYGANPDKIDEILEVIGLADAGNKKIGQFSLGMKQRIGIGVALLNEPEFLILDEPLNGLDPVGMKEIRDLIKKLNREKGITFLISSHLLEELSKTATRIGIIDGGKLVEEIGIDDINDKYNSASETAYKVNDPEKAKTIIENDEEFKKLVQDGSYINVEGGHIVIACSSDKIAYFNKVLVMNDIEVSGISSEGGNLEDYYVDKVGKA